MGDKHLGVSFLSCFASKWLIGPSVLIQHPDVIPEPDRNKMGQELYFEVLELQPIKLSLSFMRTERVTSEEKCAHNSPRFFLLT